MGHAILNNIKQIATGWGSLAELGSLAAPLGKRALLLVGQKSMQEQGHLRRAEQLLNQAGIKSQIFTGIVPEPTVKQVDAARACAADFRSEIIIGIGGGSTLDVAKATAVLLKEHEATAYYLHGGKLTQKGAGFIAIPSTFGTGSEVTNNSVLTDPEKNIKKSLRDNSLLAQAAIVDPEIGRNAPPKVKAESGLDALTQAIESFVSRQSTPVTEALSFGAIALLINSLEEFVFNNKNKEAAENCAAGSLMAGMAFTTAKLGIVHGLAHPLGAGYKMSHGQLCGILLPFALRFNKSAAPQQYNLLCGVAGCDIADFCAALLKRLGLPQDLSHLKVKEEELEKIITIALPSASMAANPRSVNADELQNFLQAVCLLKA